MSLPTPKIGLVTVLYQSDSVLPGFFKSLSAQTFKDYHLFLIDNSPTAAMPEIIDALNEQYPLSRYTYIANSENKGVAFGNNQGIELSLNAGCSHTLLLNNDIEFDQVHLLAGMYRHAVAYKEVMIVPKILFFDSRRIWMAGGRLLKWRGYTMHVGGLQEDGPAYNKPGYFDYAPTCFMLIDNSLFAEVGRMDPTYFVYFDDTDFVYRAVKRGHQVYYMPEFVILHKESTSTGGIQSPFFTFYFNRNRLFFVRKNFRGVQRAVALLVTGLAAFRNLVRYNRSSRKILFKALKEGLFLRTSERTDTCLKPIHRAQ